jgi:hypothetical protein
MATLAELFDAVPVQAWADGQPGDAAAALTHAARLLEGVGGAPLGRGQYGAERGRAAARLAAACRTGAADHRDPPGRLGELMAAAVDHAATLRPALRPDERWAVTVAAVVPIEACAAVLREHAPAPAVLDLERQLNAVSGHARALPPPPTANARLDQVLPPPYPASAAALDRAVHAVEVFRHQAATAELTAHDARHVTVVALHIALYVQHIEHTLADVGVPGADRAACEEMARLWFTARDAVRNAVAGHRAAPSSVTLARPAADAVAALTAAFGPVAAPTIELNGTPAAIATASRSIINHLPGLARDIAQAAPTWGIPRPEPISARQPIPGFLRWSQHLIL